ncbi:hypothetical protein CRG98_038479 [Punica granatum]|uniref:Protein kinase domain-containing protein n=1 Tax=Punica granatum TaxID=22663 RepID=A0A2I0IAE3_PUNGR|nr:hypothetical protein CRG98_038479 [Punica granatum]
MGCFPVLKSKKKKSEHTTYFKPNNKDHKDHPPAALPEPQIRARSLQSAPPSFKTRVKPVQTVYKVTNNRMRALSAPSALDAAEQDALSSVEYDETEDSRYRVSIREQQQQSPQPLPLPSPQSTATLKPAGSFKSVSSSGSLYTSGPLPLPPSGTLRNFSYDEISAACHNFSSDRCISEGLSFVMYNASFGDDASGSKKFEATVTRLQTSHQSIKELLNDANTLASLQHPNLCKLLGYHAREGSEQRALVYERLYHGSLDRLLHGRSDGPPIDWNTRVKIALCAAQGLTFLHEEGPFQAMYNEFSTANIQIDKDFSAKLSGYGCGGHIPDADISNSSMLKGRFPAKAARTVADMAQKCLQKDPSERPTMRTIVNHLKIIQDMKYSCRFPLQEPAAITGKQMLRSPSLNGIMTPAPRLNFSPSPPSRALPSISPKRLPGPTLPMSLPPCACSSTLSMEELGLQESRKSSSSSALRRASVEGF